MNFKSSVWFPIAVVLSVVNLVAGGFALGQGEPPHAGIHAALALAFGLWAQRLRQRRAGSGGGDIQERLEALEAEVSRVEALEGDVSRLRQELSEAQERLDFAERLLVKGREKDRAEPQR
jgi:hypothetical protein